MPEDMTVTVPAEWAATQGAGAAYLAGFAAGMSSGGAAQDAPPELWGLGYVDHTNSTRLASSEDPNVADDILAFRTQQEAAAAVEARNGDGEWPRAFFVIRLK